MRRINCCILVIAFTSCSAEVSDKANSTTAPIRTLETITDDLFRYQYAHHVSMVLNTPEGLLITDPSSKEAMISLKVELEARFDKPVRYMVYSHHHPDHIGGASVFAADTIIVAHEDTRRILEAETIDLARLPLPDVTFTEHMSLSLGGKTIELFPVRPRTHAEGMIAVRFVEDRTLYAVDIVVIEGMAWMNLNNTRFPAHIDTIKNLETMDFDYFASGHYRVSTRKEMVEHRRYLEDLQEAVQAAIDDGKSLREAKATISLDEYKHFFLYEEWLSFNVEGAYRQLKSPEYGAHVSTERVITPHEDPGNTREIVVMCAFCHGGNGMGVAPNFPNLAGQKYEYLLKSLRDFRSRRRYETNMAELELYLTEDELPRIAEYYSQLNSDKSKEIVREAEITWVKYHEAISPKTSAATVTMLTADPSLEQQPARSVADTARMVATGKEMAQACSVCHGLDGIGTAPNYPNLANQNEFYLANQIKAFRDGTRNEPLMQPTVDSLSNTDIDAVAAYYANFPAPSP